MMYWQLATAWETALWILLPIAVSGGISLIAWLVQKSRKKHEDEIATEQRRVDVAEKAVTDNAKLEREALQSRVKSLEFTLSEFSERMALMNQTVTPMYEAMKLKMVELLTHPEIHFAVPDAILAKVADPFQKPTDAEMKVLEGLLKEREVSLDPSVTREERLAAKVLPAIIKLAILEKDTLDTGNRVIEMISTANKEPTKEEKEK